MIIVEWHCFKKKKNNNLAYSQTAYKEHTNHSYQIEKADIATVAFFR